MKKFDGTETTFLKEFIKLWNDNKINTEGGTHKIAFDAHTDMFENTEMFPPKPAELQYTVNVRHYLKFLTPTDYRGVKDYITEKFKPSFIKIEDAIPFTDDKSWKFIEDPSELSINSIRLEVNVVDVQNIRFVQAELKE